MNINFYWIKLAKTIFQKEKGWFDSLTKKVQDTQSNFVNRMVEKFNDFSDEIDKQDDIKKQKTYL